MIRFSATPPLDRRAFLTAAGSGFAASLLPGAARALTGTDAVFAAAYRDASGAYGVALLSEDGTILHRHHLPGRGHDLVRQPQGTHVIAFARRPGIFATVFDLERSREPRIIAAAPGRHFYGHGVYSADGRLLYATENDFEAARGVIGVYDATDDHTRIGELDSFGIGPHDLLVLPGGHLVVANGGIETHPDYPRAKLNVPTMQPALAVIDPRTGDLLAGHELPAAMHKLSIRHLALGREGTVWFACQNEGDIAQMLPLIGRISPNTGAFGTLELPRSETLSLRGYVGSIEANRKTGHIAITSPRGNVAFEIDPAAARIVRSIRGTDICGVAPADKSFALSSGEGMFGPAHHAIGFDNHIAVL